jgi:hypothetical protein
MEEGWTLWTGEYRNDRAIGGGETEAEAWADARAKLPKLKSAPAESLQEDGGGTPADIDKFDTWLQSQPPDFVIRIYHNAFCEVLRDFIEDEGEFQKRMLQYLLGAVQEDGIIMGAVERFIKCDPSLIPQPVADGGGLASPFYANSECATCSVKLYGKKSFTIPTTGTTPGKQIVCEKCADGGRLPPLDDIAKQEIYEAKDSAFRTDDLYSELDKVRAVLHCRERQLAASQEALRLAMEELKHWEEKPFYTRNLFEDDGEMKGKDWSQVTEDDFRDLFEYSDNCKCQGCYEIRYVLQLRAQISLLSPEGSSRP